MHFCLGQNKTWTHNCLGWFAAPSQVPLLKRQILKIQWKFQNPSVTCWGYQAHLRKTLQPDHRLMVLKSQHQIMPVLEHLLVQGKTSPETQPVICLPLLMLEPNHIGIFLIYWLGYNIQGMRLGIHVKGNEDTLHILFYCLYLV